ncbi:hypothetical protein Tco_0536305 [Tanacetum coccineum]
MRCGCEGRGDEVDMNEGVRVASVGGGNHGGDGGVVMLLLWRRWGGGGDVVDRLVGCGVGWRGGGVGCGGGRMLAGVWPEVAGYGEEENGG